MSVSRIFNGPADGEWLTAPKEKPTDFSALISDDAVGMVQAFIEGRCEVKLAEYDIREALEVYLACTLEEIKARYGIIAVPVQYEPEEPKRLHERGILKRIAQAVGLASLLYLLALVVELWRQGR